MGDSQRTGTTERDVEQAITALKKGATLLKYGRRGKPKFCPFRLSNDESLLIWCSGKEEKHIKLSQVSKVIPGQRTTIFQRYPRPEKEYQSFSLICDDRTLDLICKDKDEAEVWLFGLNSLISNSNRRKLRSEPRESNGSSGSSNARKNNQSFSSSDPGDIHNLEGPPQIGLGKAFSDIIVYTSSSKSFTPVESAASTLSLPSFASAENSNVRISTSDNFRVSLSSAISSSSHGSCHDDFDSLGDVLIWGEGIGEGVLGGGTHIDCSSSGIKSDAFLPRVLESTVVLDVHQVSCGSGHAVLVTRQGEIFSWGKESGGRLGHGADLDFSHPKLIDALRGMNIEIVACGEYHTCASTFSGDIYTWGDGTYNCGLLGHGSETSHWVPKRVGGPMDSMHVTYVACGPWHTAAVTSTGQLFTFGVGTFGALGHGDNSSTAVPREVETLRGLKTLRVACGSWHTAAIVEIVASEALASEALGKSLAGKLFTWGDGDCGQLGHGDSERRLFPSSVASLMNLSFCKVACGHDLTLAVTNSGRVYSMGSAIYGQLGNPSAEGKVPDTVEGKIAACFVEDIACGSHHVAVLTSKTEVFTWGKGTKGQLGHGDNCNRSEPTLVDFLKDKQVKSVACGSNFTAVICLHKSLSSADNAICTGCHNPFNFRRKRHNCYNCGLVFCKACSSHKSLKASLAPNMNKPYRVCDDCFLKLKRTVELGAVGRIPRPSSKNHISKSTDASDKDTPVLKFAAHVARISQTLKRTNSGSSKCESKIERHDSGPNGNLPGGVHTSIASVPIFGAPSMHISASAPGFRFVSRSASPISQRSSPTRSTTTISSTYVLSSPGVVTHDPNHRNENLNREINRLRAQVEDLTCNIQYLESELEKTSTQLKEANVALADEADKSKASEEVIKSLTAQLKEMAKREQEISSTSNNASHHGQNPGSPSARSNDSHLTGVISPRSESKISKTDLVTANRSKAQSEKTEWVVQDEPGVYVTLSSLPTGGNELRRVRFSRKRFTEEQAEKWWADNSAKVLERHDIKST